MMIAMILMVIKMTKPYDYADDTDDDHDHKNDSYTAAGAALGASVPWSSFRFLRSGSFVPVPSFRFLRSGSFVPVPSHGSRLGESSAGKTEETSEARGTPYGARTRNWKAIESESGPLLQRVAASIRLAGSPMGNLAPAHRCHPIMVIGEVLMCHNTILTH